MSRTRVSMLDFIRTGTLKGIGVGSEMRACGELLGPPEVWEYKWENYFPAIWCYGDVQIYMEEKEPGNIYVSYMMIMPGSSRRDNKIAGRRGLALSPGGLESCMLFAPFMALMESNGIKCEDAFNKYLKPGVRAYIRLNGKTYATFLSDENDESVLWLSALEAYGEQDLRSTD